MASNKAGEIKSPDGAAQSGANSKTKSAAIDSPKEDVYAAMEQWERASDDTRYPEFIRTGLDDVDALITGFFPGDLIVVGGRPGIGKTSFGLGLAIHAAIDQAVPTAYFSQEIANKELFTTRLLASEACVSHRRISAGKLSEEETVRVGRAAGLLSQAPIWLESLSTPTLASLWMSIEAAAQSSGVRLVIVDYLQLLETPGAESRYQGIATISRGLKNLARERNISIVVLSQCSRAPEQRSGGDKRPQLADLRDSGAIEDDADLVMFLYRQEYYDKLEGRDPYQPNRWGEISAGQAEVIVAKQRKGPTGIASVLFSENYTRFASRPAKPQADESSE